MMLQRGPGGISIFIAECSSCRRDVRDTDLPRLLLTLNIAGWAFGNFHGSRSFICDLCQWEALTGFYITGWRWGLPAAAIGHSSLQAVKLQDLKTE